MSKLVTPIALLTLAGASFSQDIDEPNLDSLVAPSKASSQHTQFAFKQTDESGLIKEVVLPVSRDEKFLIKRYLDGKKISDWNFGSKELLFKDISESKMTLTSYDVNWLKNPSCSYITDRYLIKDIKFRSRADAAVSNEFDPNSYKTILYSNDFNRLSDPLQIVLIDRLPKEAFSDENVDILGGYQFEPEESSPLKEYFIGGVAIGIGLLYLNKHRRNRQ